MKPDFDELPSTAEEMKGHNMSQQHPRSESPATSDKKHEKSTGPTERKPIDLATESVVGEEDPGAALTQKPVADAAKKMPDKRSK